MRKNNKKNEEEHIQQLIKHIDDATETGTRIKRKFEELTGSKLVQVTNKRSTGGDGNGGGIVGGRGDKWDLEITTEENRVFTVEVKASKQKMSRINGIDDGNGVLGVQFANGPGTKFTITRLYAEKWYDEVLGAVIDKMKEFGVHAEKPEKDQYVSEVLRASSIGQLNTQTPVYNCINHIYSLYKKNRTFSYFLRNVKNEFTKRFDVTDLRILQEIPKSFEECLDQKDFLLQLAGPWNNLEFKWDYVNTDKFKATHYGIDLSGSDIEVCFFNRDVFLYKAKVRWGARIGVCNVRVDVTFTGPKRTWVSREYHTLV